MNVYKNNNAACIRTNSWRASDNQHWIVILVSMQRRLKPPASLQSLSCGEDGQLLIEQRPLGHRSRYELNKTESYICNDDEISVPCAALAGVASPGSGA